MRALLLVAMKIAIAIFTAMDGSCACPVRQPGTSVQSEAIGRPFFGHGSVDSKSTLTYDARSPRYRSAAGAVPFLLHWPGYSAEATSCVNSNLCGLTTWPLAIRREAPFRDHFQRTSCI